VEAALKELASAQSRLDALTYAQEYDADFIFFEGRAYYSYNANDHTRPHLKYDPTKPLILCFDFNIAPGVCCICQEDEDRGVTWVIDEVYLPKNSNTLLVCAKVLQKGYAQHRGEVHLYGDATGGADRSNAIHGSDWDLVTQCMFKAFPGRCHLMVGASNPPERVRLNAVNSRLRTANGVVRLLVSNKAPYTQLDLDGVRLVKNGTGEIDKAKDRALTHISDALGYYIARRHPINPKKTVVTQY